MFRSVDGGVKTVVRDLEVVANQAAQTDAKIVFSNFALHTIVSRAALAAPAQQTLVVVPGQGSASQPAPAPTTFLPVAAPQASATLISVPPQQPFPLLLAVDKPAYKVGEKVTLAVTTLQACNLTVMDVTASGQVRTLFPNQMTPNSRRRAADRFGRRWPLGGGVTGLRPGRNGAGSGDLHHRRGAYFVSARRRSVGSHARPRRRRFASRRCGLHGKSDIHGPAISSGVGRGTPPVLRPQRIFSARRPAMQRSLQFLALIAALGAAAWPVAAQTSPPPATAQMPAETAADRSGDKQLLADSQAKLAWELIERLSARGGTDPTISPASLASVFGIIGEGADTAMKAAIAKTLGFVSTDAPRALAALVETRAELAAGNGELFQSADRIVFAPNALPNPQLGARLEKLGVTYSAEDLSKPEAVAKIDAWVKEVTKGAIPEILGGPLDNASFVALNALHFKGRWKTPFDPKLTSPAPFTGAEGKSDDVAMMRLPEAQRAYRTDKTFIGVDLPFSGEQFSLIVVTTTDKPLPAKGFAKAADWLSGTGFAQRKGDLDLPRFRVSGRFDLLPALDAMGLEKERHSATALAGFGQGTVLTQVVQRAMIEVDEEGAEAAAATAAMAARALKQDEALHMIVDKPFIFALRDRATGLILVAGYVGHAPKGKAE